MALGKTSCTANVEGALVCTVITVQRVINASLGQACSTYNTHSVTLTWVASVTPGVSGYQVYRGTASGGPYTLVSSTGTSLLAYTDLNVTAGLSYYYVVTAMDVSGNESDYSNEAAATVPTP